MNKIKQYGGYIAIVVSYLIINFLFLHKWITVEYDNNYAGGLAIPLFLPRMINVCSHWLVQV